MLYSNSSEFLLWIPFKIFTWKSDLIIYERNVSVANFVQITIPYHILKHKTELFPWNLEQLFLKLLKILLLTISMCCFQDKYLSMNTPKKFVICTLLIRIFLIARLGKVCGSNCFFEREWNNNHLVLWTFRNNLFDLNHVETFSSSTFILEKNVSMFL